MSYDKDAVNQVVVKAGEHCKKILSNLIRDLNLNECQLDELWVFIKKINLFPKRTSKKNMADIDLGLDRSGIKVDYQFLYRPANIGGLQNLH